MRYWASRIASFFVGFAPVLARLKASEHYDLAFEISCVRDNILFSRNATFQYTIQCAELTLERAELAFLASAYEHSWACASDAKLVLEWNDNYDSTLGHRASELISLSAKEIDAYRVEELIEKHDGVKHQYESDFGLRRAHQNDLFGTAKIPGYRRRIKHWRRQRISQRPF